MKRYEPFEHTADIGVRVFGRTYEEIFANGAYALFDHLTELGAVEEKISLSISLQGQDAEDLLVRWLNELLYLYESQGFLPKGASFSHLDQRSLSAEVRGERFDPSRHIRKMEIKAVTYHQVRVQRADGIWEARVVFDV